MAMKRTKEPTVTEKKAVAKETPPVDNVERTLLKYRKKPGGGTFRLRNNKIIKPNQVFEAFPDEIPKAFRDQIECLEPTVEEKPLEVVETEYKLAVSAEEAEKFDVLNSYNKKINETPLTRDEAEKLIEDLEK